MKAKTLLTALFCLFLAILVCHGQNISSWNEIPEDIKNTNVFKRFEWEYKQRAFPFDTVPYLQYHQEKCVEIKKIKSKSRKNLNQLTWLPLGPIGLDASTISLWSNWGLTGGRVRAVAVHPTDPLTVYIGAAGGGIWKSTDGGENWMDIGHDLQSLSFGAIAIDPNNPETIYAGSGESVFLTGIMHFSGVGLYKSINGGSSWDTITDGFGSQTHFSDITVSPFDSNIIFAAMASGCFYLGELSNEGIWKSMDGGMTWNRVLDVTDAWDIIFHPIDQDTIYAAVGGANNNAGFYISSDQGETWQLNANFPQSSNTISRMHIDIALSDPNVIYAVTHQPGSNLPFFGTTRAFKSEDGGVIWSQISEGIPLGGNFGSGWRDQGFYDLCIAINPSNPNHVLIGNIELHETTDGTNFSPKRPYGNNAYGGITHVDIHQLIFAPSNPEYLYIGCDGGIYQSTDACVSATSINHGLETLQFYRVASHPANHDILIGGMQDNGTARTEDGGNSWHSIAPGDGTECFYDYSDPNLVYYSMAPGKLAKSTNGGNSFTIIELIYGSWITPFFMHPENSNWLYAANKRVLLSTTASAPINPLFENDELSYINTLAQSSVNSDHMIFATGGLGLPMYDSIILVKVSTDSGYNWQDVTDNIPGEDRWITRVVTDPTDEYTMYIVRTGFSAGNKVYMSTDLGLSWENITGDLPNLPCNDLFIDPYPTGLMCVANDLGVYMSTNGGENWVYAGGDMPIVPAMDFDYVEINETSRYLRVGTHGRSIYETNLADFISSEQEQNDLGNNNNSIQLEVFPNPVNQKVNIKFHLQKSQVVLLTISNIVGQNITNLISKQLNAGPHNIEWCSEGLKPGIYFCILKTSPTGAGQTKKIIKL